MYERPDMDPIGKNPLPWPVFLLGKTAMIACWLFFLVRIAYPEAMLFDSAATEFIGVLLFVAGSGAAVVSIAHLGRSVSVGLPQTTTELKTHGLYRLSRNPIYAGAFLMCAGSCLIAVHPVNLLLFVLMAAIHHAIVLKEERFLRDRFGHQWLEYAQRVPRYLGRVRRPAG